MARLVPCPSCSCHVLVDERECPGCGATLRTTAAPRVAAAVVGLALGGCIVAEPAYGVPDPSTTTGGTMGTSTEGDTADTEGTTATAGSEGTSTGMADSTTGDTDATAGSDTVGEPDYGVPATTTSG